MSTQISSNILLLCIFSILHRDVFVHTFRMYAVNLFTSGGQHKIFWPTSSVDIIPESCSSFQDLIILKRDFWCWACNLFNCIQLVIFLEMFTKCFQNRCYQFLRVRVQQRGLHLKIRPISCPNFLLHALQSSSP